MTRELAVAIMIASAVVILAAIWFGWRARARRDNGYAVPQGEAPHGSTQGETFATLYVATTRHDEPLERLAISGLTYRSRADVVVYDTGVAVDLTGQSRIFFSRERITAVRQAQVAIDRVVEKDGLVRLDWVTDSGETVNSYFRPQTVSARVVTDDIAAILSIPTPDTTPTGLDA